MDYSLPFLLLNTQTKKVLDKNRTNGFILSCHCTTKGKRYKYGECVLIPTFRLFINCTKSIAMLRSVALLALLIIACCSTLVSAASSAHTNANQWNRRPRQFRMQIFSRPDSKGAVQTIRATNGGRLISCRVYIYIWHSSSTLTFCSFFSLLEFGIKKSGILRFKWPISQSYLLQSKFIPFRTRTSCMKITIAAFSHQIVKVLPQPLFIRALWAAATLWLKPNRSLLPKSRLFRCGTNNKPCNFFNNVALYNM